MKKTDEYKSPVLQNRLDEMVEKISKAIGVKPQEPGQPPKLGRWAHMQGKQYASTEANLARKGERNWDEPFSSDAIANPGARNPDEANRRDLRPLSPDEISVFQSMRHNQKNTIGQSEKSSVTPEARERAVHHFEVSGSVPPEALTEADKRRITNLKPIESANPTEVVIKKLTAWQAFCLWLAGGKVWEEKE